MRCFHPSPRLLAIYISPDSAAPVRAVPRVRALAGRGLEGDRYTLGRGVWTPPPGTREVTLVAAEALSEFARETGRPLSAALSRRNLVTMGVDLNALVGRKFRVGPVWLEGTERCQPCAHLARLTGWPEVLRGLQDRGGLGARILNDADLTVGDVVAAPPAITDPRARGRGDARDAADGGEEDDVSPRFHRSPELASRRE